MKVLFNYLKRLDWGIIICVLILNIFGLLGIYSVCLAKNNFLNFYKQLSFIIIGFLLMFGLSFFDYRVLKNNSYLILTFYIVSLILLGGLYFFAPIIRGTKGWYKFGFFSLDPTEIAKIALLLLLSKYFSLRHTQIYHLRHIIFSGLYSFIPAFLIFLKPDLGGATILLLVWLGILLISGLKRKHILILLIFFLIAGFLSWFFLLKDYQKQRIYSFLFPYDYLAGSWSQFQSKISIGSGKILGKGFNRGTQVSYGFLPEPHTDFIFSVIAEEWGFLGISILFLTYCLLVWRILKIAINSYFNFARFLISGFVIILISHFFINVGMNLSFLPVIGIYLPFVSYGGSGILANFIILGIIQSIKLRS